MEIQSFSLNRLAFTSRLARTSRMAFSKLILSFVGVVLLLMGGCSQSADTSTPDPRTREIATAIRLKQFSTALELTAEQQTKIKTLLNEENLEMDKIHESATRTGEDRVLKIKALRQSTYDQIKPLLTPEQLEKYDAVVKKLEKRKR